MSIYVDISKKLGSFLLKAQFSANDEILGILGSSGCGKSMTLKCIAGIITPDEGEIILNDKILFSSKKKINLSPQKRNVGLMFQNYALFPNMTVEKNIGIGIEEKNEVLKKEIIKYYLDLLQISEYKDKYPPLLSGGQQQRVALGRMMAKNPDILMLDEPFSALDTELRFSIESEFLKILKNYNKTAIYVSHSIDEVYTYCDKTAIMSEGKILEIANTENIFNKPATLEGAKLTGCKNISKIKRISESSVFAIDWGITLEINSHVDETANYIGIRETDIYVSNIQKHENCFPLSIADVKQTPSNTILSFNPNRSKISYPLLCTYQKDKTNSILELEKQGNLYGNIKKDKILLLK